MSKTAITSAELAPRVGRCLDDLFMSQLTANSAPGNKASFRLVIALDCWGIRLSVIP